MKKLNLLLTAGFMAIASMAFAQDALTDNHTVTVGVPEVAILDIEPSASNLKLTAGAPANGVGDVGTAGSQITLSTTAQTILTGIGSCYTTDGVNNGSNLTYEVALPVSTTDYNSIFISSTAVTVTYTITDDV